MLTSLFPHYPALVLVLTTALVLMGGAIAQVIAHRLGIPAILLLLFLGMLLGPDGLGIVEPAIYGTGLRAVVSIAVAVIVFEGALMIDARQLRRGSRSVLGLVTVGALTTFGLAGVLAHGVAGLPWKIACLFGAIVSVTGPTVVGPILRRLHLGRRLSAILEAESVFVDAVGVLLTAAVFSYMTGSAGGAMGGVIQLFTNLITGSAVGVATALALRAALTRGRIPSEFIRVAVFAAVLLGYSLAEARAHESGIAAVAVAGLMMGSMRLPEEETIRRFKGDLTLIALSLVFVLLAASMPLVRLQALGWRGVMTVLALMIGVRPLAVWIATWGAGLTWRERAFIAWMGPRGIVAASMASLMAIELKSWGLEGGDTLAGLVFLTVLLTVSIQGGGARWVATRLDLVPQLVVGGDPIARELAGLHVQEGRTVLVDSEPARAGDEPPTSRLGDDA